MRIRKNKYYSFFLCIFFFISCNNTISEEDLLNKKDPIGLYGSKITLEQISSISNILNNPDNYLNQQVLISGNIIDVCPMRGCWINVKEIQTDSKIRIKVIDGQIIFPLSSLAKNVIVQGTLQKLEFTRDQAINWKIHLAEEKGEILHRDSVKLDHSDLVEYRINGYAAEITN